MGRDRHRNPSRQTRPAYSATRRTWYGYGSLARVEKSGFGRVLHDCSYVFGDISIPSIPILFVVMAAPGTGVYDATAAGLLAWMTTVAVGTAIRGGWIGPLARSSPRSRRRLAIADVHVVMGFRPSLRRRRFPPRRRYPPRPLGA